MQQTIARVVFFLILASGLALSIAWEGDSADNAADRASDSGSRTRDTPGDFDYYALVLSWSPAYCAGGGRDRYSRQCDPAKDRAFVLHGLWPQHEHGWPEHCYTGRRPWLPEHVIDAMLDIMPSRGLVIHEYSTHGTCSGLDPADYYAAARTLYDRVNIPDRYAESSKVFNVSPAQIERDFIAANAWLKPERMVVACRDRALYDIRLCFSKDLEPIVCGPNQNQRRLCPLNRIAVPPAGDP